MRYSMIAKSEAPAQGPERRKRRIPEIDDLVRGLEPGRVAQIELGEDEKARLVIEQIFKAGARQGKVVDVWEVGGKLYAEQMVGAAD
ncbi:MAG: hypothetical protein H0U10_12760 [Chloroflexia bacterium]|nr:hypothetical protein [Chloroflexia bacterium]